jgi:hypothetical protein
VANLGLGRAHLAGGDRAAAGAQLEALRRLAPNLARMLEQEMR